MNRRPASTTRRLRFRLAALGLAVLLLAVAPAALASPRHSVESAGQQSTGSSWFMAVAGGLSAVWQQILSAFGGGKPGDGVPGTGIDPDGHHARLR
jgi:hypothetical protein